MKSFIPNIFEKLVHLVGFIIRIYHDAWPPKCQIHIFYKEKYIEQIMNTKILGLRTDNHINLKNHIEQMIPKLSEACNAIKSMVLTSNVNTLKSIYYACFHSIIKYGIIFWGNASNSTKIFTSQKQIIRIMTVAQPKTCCRNLFTQSETPSIPCLYIQ